MGFSAARTVVVGTTSDYVEMIRARHPGRALFLTDPAERRNAHEPPPSDAEELLRPLDDPAECLRALQAHCARHGLAPAGIACYDCESMALAASLAQALGLSYPSPEAVAVCRSKFASTQRWRAAGLPCPEAGQLRHPEEAPRFLERLRGGKMVLKPLTGSGGELVFVCSTPEDCLQAFAAIRGGLAARAGSRMHRPFELDGRWVDPLETVVAEEFADGPEYSCDFLVDGDAVTVVRVARKLPAPRTPHGTAGAYALPEPLPPELHGAAFERQLLLAARAVGIVRALCMLDFIVVDGRAVMLEIAPRPGGDCLPQLIHHSCGLDMLALALDVAEGLPPRVPPAAAWRRLVGMRLLAPRPGVIAALDAGALRQDPRAVEVALTRGPGHRVVQPPDDYDSRVLGWALFSPAPAEDLETACGELGAKLELVFAGDGR